MVGGPGRASSRRRSCSTSSPRRSGWLAQLSFATTRLLECATAAPAALRAVVPNFSSSPIFISFASFLDATATRGLRRAAGGLCELQYYRSCSA